MKRVMIALGILFLVGAIAIPVLARGPGCEKGRHGSGPYGGCPAYGRQYDKGFGNLTDEQRTQLDQLHRKFYHETHPLKKEIWSRMYDLDFLLNSPEPDADKARALQKEISDLKARMAEKRLEFELQARKINPDARLGWGCGRGFGGYGHHTRGYHMMGPRMGLERHRGGYGPGSCWN